MATPTTIPDTGTTKNPYKTATIILATTLTLIILIYTLTGNRINLSTTTITALTITLTIYILYREYEKWQRTVNYTKMTKQVIQTLQQEGQPFNNNPDTIILEPIGLELYACQTHKHTYLLTQNQVIGKTNKSIAKLLEDQNRYALPLELAKKGINPNGDE